MKSFAVLALFALVAVAVAEEFYTGKWDNYDYKPVIGNDRLWKNTKDCILGKKTTGCTAEVSELKRVLPEALETTCAKCSPVQIEKIREVFAEVCRQRRDDVPEFLDTFDKTKAYREKFQAKYGKLAGDCS